MEKLVFRMSGYHPPSTNDMYVPTSGRRKVSQRTGRSYSRSYLRKSDWLIDWQAKVARMFSSEFFYTEDELKSFKENVGKSGAIQLKLLVSMPLSHYGNRSLKANDATNHIKAIEDSLATGLGIDDRHNLVVVVEKTFNTNDNWYIKAEFTKIGEAWDDKFKLENFEGEKVYEFNK